MTICGLYRLNAIYDLKSYFTKIYIKCKINGLNNVN